MNNLIAACLSVGLLACASGDSGAPIGTGDSGASPVGPAQPEQVNFQDELHHALGDYRALQFHGDTLYLARTISAERTALARCQLSRQCANPEVLTETRGTPRVWVIDATRLVYSSSEGTILLTLGDRIEKTKFADGKASALAATSTHLLWFGLGVFASAPLHNPNATVTYELPDMATTGEPWIATLGADYAVWYPSTNTRSSNIRLTAPTRTTYGHVTGAQRGPLVLTPKHLLLGPQRLERAHLSTRMGVTLRSVAGPTEAQMQWTGTDLLIHASDEADLQVARCAADATPEACASAAQLYSGWGAAIMLHLHDGMIYGTDGKTLWGRGM